jgi:predicted esterase
MSAREVDTTVVEARTHGRYSVAAPVGEPAGILIGCHGYGENGGDHLAELTRIPHAERWALVAVDALHAFYDRKSQRVVRSWMTRDLRAESIEDNLRYVRAILESVRRRFGWRLPVVLLGFSQGASMAWRTALLGGHEVEAVVALAGDVPPELAELPPAPFPRRALLGRGDRDEWYSEAKLAADVRLLEARDVSVTTMTFAGGHEWSEPFRAALGALLAGLGGDA